MTIESLQSAFQVSNVDFYGGGFVPNQSLENTKIIWQRQPDRSIQKPQTRLPNSLLQVELALRDLYENEQYVSEMVRAYIDADERTKAFEATTKGIVMETYQAWNEKDKELVAYSFPTIKIYEKGLADIALLREKFGPEIDFEENRRKIELSDAIKLQDAISSGKMNSQLKVTISPFPVGSNSKVAREIGYFTEKMIAMIRIQEYDPEFKIMKTSQIMLEGTDLDAFTKMAVLLTGISPDQTLSPEELLATEIYIPKRKIGGIVDLARIYDRILENENGDSFFLGEKKEHSISDYKDISEKTKEVEEATKPIIKHLVKTDIELAKSLYYKHPSKFIEEAINTALNAVDKNGKPLLNKTKRSLVLNSLVSFSIEAAEVIKDFVTKTDYMGIICITDEKRARNLFPTEQVYDYRKSFSLNPCGTLATPPTLTPRQDIFFFFCGEMLKFNTGEDVFNMTPGQFNSFIKEAIPSSKWEYHKGNCVNKGCEAQGVDVGPCEICKKCEKVL